MDELNRDLLVAVLALLTDAAPRPGLVAALKSWSQDRQQPLAQVLKQAACLDDDHVHALECLATAHLKTHNNDLRLSVDALNAHELTQDVLTEISDDTLRTTLNSTLVGETPVQTSENTLGFSGSLDPAQPLQFNLAERFELIRKHARGGIGQVWVARDRELQREVALKVIQDRYAEREDQRARFVLEAEITGKLEHPGIVPVYSLGRNADGRPYYAMRFIRGESLSVAIRRFHKESAEEAEASKGTRSMWGIAFRQLLGRFLDVCDAIDYAHSRGVLHRDLKPANIMLGRYGETLVVDWGLAKVIGTGEVIPTATGGEFEPALAGASVTFSGETQPGTTIGTPSYMSPEQARGLIDQLGPASDVYSLGATLYELLTGKVAFSGEKGSEVIERVIKGDFPSPRTACRSMPAQLEAICLKAMAKEPERRYASVHELARDLEHWLADEPVAAYPERRLERLGRWLRQHRTWTYAAVAALAGITLAATIGVGVVDWARRREADARKEAETNFSMAQSAVEDYLTRVSENTLLKEQDSVDIRGLRRELLANALQYYQRFVSQRSSDPLLRRELANAYSRVAEITREIGKPQEAIDAFRSAATIWESLIAADRADHSLKGRLADCQLAIGNLQTLTDDFEAAMNSLTRARATLEPLAAEHSEVASYQASLAECCLETGNIQAQLKSPDQGLGMLERAKAIQQGLIDRDPAGPGYQKRLAEIINALGLLFYNRHDYPAALQSFQEVQGICRSLLESIAAGPKPVLLLNILAISHYNIATIQLMNNQLDEALQSFEQSLEYLTALVDAHPSVTQFQEHLGKNLGEIALRQHGAGQVSKAFASIRKSIDVLEKLVQSQPDQPRYHSDLGRSWNILGYFHDKDRDNGLAINAFEHAVKEKSNAVAASPDVDSYKVELCNHLDNLGEQYVALGKVGDALPHYRRGIEIWRKLVADHQGNQQYLLTQAEALSKLGSIERHGGDSAAAAKSFAQARGIVERAAAGDAALQGRLGAVLAREAVAKADLKQADEALRLLRRAVDILSPLGTSPSADEQSREWLSESLWELARLLGAAHMPVEAGGRDAERLALWKNRPPGELAALALRQASRDQIGYGKTPLTAPARSVRELDLDQAAAHLRMAISLGFKDLAMLKADRDSGILLARSDVQPLIKDLESPQLPPSLQPQK